jgi:hypothetical protein
VLACAVAGLIAPAAASATSAALRVVAGGGMSTFTSPGTQIAPLSVQFATPLGIDTDQGGESFWIADPDTEQIYRLSPQGVGWAAGNGNADYDPASDIVPMQATSTSINSPDSVSATGVGSFLIADTENSRIRWVNSFGYISTVAGPTSGTADADGFDGDGGDPVAAHMAYPHDVEAIAESSTDYFIADTGNHVIRKVVGGPAGTITTEIGVTFPGPGDIGTPEAVAAISATDYWVTANLGGAGHLWHRSNATTSDVSPLTWDTVSGATAIADGGVLVYDGGLGRIMRVSADGLTVTTVAGSTTGAPVAGVPADEAKLESWGDVTVGRRGVYFTQGFSDRVWLVPASALTGGPGEGSFSSSSSASFGLTSWDTGATFECTVDGNTVPCDSAAGLDASNLADGAHTATAKATTTGSPSTATFADDEGSTRHWKVDTTPPNAFGLTSPDDGATVGAHPTLSWPGTSDPAPGAIDRYEVTLDGAPVGTVAAGCAPCSVAPPTLGDGAHTWSVRAFDKAGHSRDSGQRTFTVNEPPVAQLAIGPNRTLAGVRVTFSADGSSDPNGQIARHEWDLDGDGSYETDTGPDAVVARTYSKAQTLTIGLRVTDSAGLTATASGPLVISVLAPPGKPIGVSVNDGAQFTNDADVKVFAVWPSGMSSMLISNDGGFKLAQTFPVQPETDWKLDSSGPERLPKTIYVRFTGGNLTSETFQDDIILDQTAPKVTAAALSSGAGSRPSAAAVKKVTLKIAAKDNVSGVARMQVTTSKRRPGKLRRYAKRVKVKPARAYYVRVRDRAGNLSRWRTAKRR